MAGLRGPIEFGAAEAALAFTFLGLIPPFVVAVVGAVMHALVAVLAGKRDVVLLTLFLTWWAWCTAIWVAGLVVAVVFN